MTGTMNVDPALQNGLTRMTNHDIQLRKRLAELMSSAGLGYNSISLEVLYLLPEEFIGRYIWLWEKALGPAGSGDNAGRQADRDGGLGVAKTETGKRGVMPTGASSTQKKWKRMGLAIRDEKALELKDRIDRRLRSIARDIRSFEVEGGLGTSGKKTAQCTKCGRVGEERWAYCPYDAAKMRVGAEGRDEGQDPQ